MYTSVALRCRITLILQLLIKTVCTSWRSQQRRGLNSTVNRLYAEACVKKKKRSTTVELGSRGLSVVDWAWSAGRKAGGRHCTPAKQVRSTKLAPRQPHHGGTASPSSRKIARTVLHAGLAADANGPMTGKVYVLTCVW